MINTLRAAEWEYVPPSTEGWLFELPNPLSVVRFDFASEKELHLSGIDLNGEVIFFQKGGCFSFAAQLEGFKALHVTGGDGFSVRAFASSGREFRDPTPMVIVEAKPVDPVRLAMADEVRKQFEKWKLDGLFNDPAAADKEIDEFVEDLVDGDMDFEEGDDEFGLPAAAELEEERVVADREATIREAREEAARVAREKAQAEAEDGEVEGADPPSSPAKQLPRRPSKAAPAKEVAGDGE